MHVTNAFSGDAMLQGGRGEEYHRFYLNIYSAITYNNLWDRT